jgi:arsenical pump membrane protein
MISNLVNLIAADFFGIGFVEYAAVMVVVNLVSVAASLAVLLVTLLALAGWLSLIR